MSKEVEARIYFVGIKTTDKKNLVKSELDESIC